MTKELKPSFKEPVELPKGIVIAGAWSWRLLAIFAALAVVMYVGSMISEVIIPFAIAILVAALIVPIVNRLRRKGWPKALAIVTSLLGTVVIVSGLIVLIVTQIHRAFPELESRGKAAYASLKDFLISPAIGFSQQDIDNALRSIGQYIQDHSQAVTAGLTSAGSTFGHILVGLLLGIFTLIFILIDGAKIWQFFVRLFPKKAQPAINGSGEVSWIALKSFVKSQVIVAAVNGVGIGLGAFFIGLPLAIPIAIMVFLGSFIPVVGAILTGAIAVVIALIFNGPIAAIVMLGVVIAVQQAEGHLLQPFLIGKAVHIHPLAIVLSVAIGTILGGIPGALFAVPVVAVLSKSVSYIYNRRWEKEVKTEVITAK